MPSAPTSRATRATGCAHGADHLLFRLLELVVDQSLPAIEHLDDRVDDDPERGLRSALAKVLRTIFRIKRSAIRLHKTLAPQREVLNRLARDPYEPIRDEHRVYFRDLYDHLVRVHDISESLRDLIAGTLDTYLSVISNRTNDIMKTLTIVTVMFLPMSFLAGFFGMNFFGESLVLQGPLPRACSSSRPARSWRYPRVSCGSTRSARSGSDGRTIASDRPGDGHRRR